MKTCKISAWIKGLALFLLVCFIQAKPPGVASSQEEQQVELVGLHSVRYGESFESIALQLGIQAQHLAEFNMLDPGLLPHIGQVLLLPAGIEMAPEPGAGVVGLAETLREVAARGGEPAIEFAHRNRIVHCSSLFAGLPVLLGGDISGHPSRTVSASDRLGIWSLAYQANISPQSIMLLNTVGSPYTLSPDHYLSIPCEDDCRLEQETTEWSVAMKPLPCFPGSTCGVSIRSTEPGIAGVEFLGQSWPVAEDAGSYAALIGVNRWLTPGRYPIRITLIKNDGTAFEFERDVWIADGDYSAEVIVLSPDIDALLNDEAVTQGELLYLVAVMTGFRTERFWDGTFQMPVEGEISSPFGTLRSYNDRGFFSYHAGLDVAVPTGTPVVAPADGVVVDSSWLVVRGLATVIDHGWGVYSGFWHQSSSLVSPGDLVHAGQQIGAVGNTGLSTAAHLHWELWVNGFAVNPLQWVEVSFP
nr:LysM peptidoglycan-binding domain-containing M23 family metallopeptidase [Anaerolineae bacterium]